MNHDAENVLRLSLANNAGINDLSLVHRVISFLPNMIELDLSNTGIMESIGPDFFGNNPVISNLNLAGTQSGCWSNALVDLLQRNLKNNIRVFKNKIVFANWE